MIFSIAFASVGLKLDCLSRSKLRNKNIFIDRPDICKVTGLIALWYPFQISAVNMFRIRAVWSVDSLTSGSSSSLCCLVQVDIPKTGIVDIGF